jgi:hypothetical protein
MRNAPDVLINGTGVLTQVSKFLDIIVCVKYNIVVRSPNVYTSWAVLTA